MGRVLRTHGRQCKTVPQEGARKWRLTLDELATVMAEVEATINCRPQT